MTLYPAYPSGTSWTFDNFGANPSATPGTSVTPGASNVEGSWTQVASAANIANDVYGFFLMVSGGATSTAAKNQLIDIGVDPAGGTSYTAIISNLVCGASPLLTAPGNREHFFPMFIKAGSTVAVRIQGSNATAGTVRVAMQFYGKPAGPIMIPTCYVSETIGTITNSSGVSFTPGNAADGSWVSLGTTVRPLWWWQLGYQVDNGTITAEYTYIDLAYGDGTNKHQIFRVQHGGTTGETCGLQLQTQLCHFAAVRPVPAGATIYVRGRCNNAPDTGYNAVAVGCG
jgi:hypothetical protein